MRWSFRAGARWVAGSTPQRRSAWILSPHTGAVGKNAPETSAPPLEFARAGSGTHELSNSHAPPLVVARGSAFADASADEPLSQHRGFALRSRRRRSGMERRLAQTKTTFSP